MEIRQKKWPLASRPSRLLKVIGTDTDRSATYDFLLVIHSNDGHISYRFRDKRQFRPKVANFSHSGVVSAPLREFPLNFVAALALKNTYVSIRFWREFDDMDIRLDAIAGARASTDAAGNPAFRHLLEDVVLNLFQPVDQEEVISLITSLPNKQCRSNPLPIWLLKECSVCACSCSSSSRNEYY